MNFALSLRIPGVFVAVGVGCSAQATPCAGATGCPRAQECLAMRCVREGSVPVLADTERVVALPSALALATRDDAAALGPNVTLGSAAPAALYLQFEPVWRSGRVHAAFLVLDPAAATLSGEDVELEVWRARRPFQGSVLGWGSQPGVLPPYARGIARARPALPVRIDVTELVRFAADHPAQHHGFAVRAREGGPAGITLSTGTGGGRAPELDVYVSSRRAPSGR